jgi:hypothetical protein
LSRRLSPDQLAAEWQKQDLPKVSAGGKRLLAGALRSRAKLLSRAPHLSPELFQRLASRSLERAYSASIDALKEAGKAGAAEQLKALGSPVTSDSLSALARVAESAQVEAEEAGSAASRLEAVRDVVVHTPRRRSIQDDPAVAKQAIFDLTKASLDAILADNDARRASAALMMYTALEDAAQNTILVETGPAKHRSNAAAAAGVSSAYAVWGAALLAFWGERVSGERVDDVTQGDIGEPALRAELGRQAEDLRAT